jgi:hypothetical protein
MPSALAWKTNYLSEGLSLLTSEYQKPRPVVVPPPPVVGLPTVTGIAPATGVDAGATAVTLTGTGFTGATGGTLDGVALTSFVVVSGTTITALSGAGLAHGAPGTVTITNAQGTGTLPSAWEYIDMLVGLLSARPVAAVAGRAYFATDTLTEYVDTGSAWSIPRGFPAGQVTHAMPDSNDVFNANDLNASILKVTGTTTADRTLSYAVAVSDLIAWEQTIVNATSGGFNVIVAGPSGTSVAVGPGAIILRYDSTGVSIVPTVGAQ